MHESFPICPTPTCVLDERAHAQIGPHCTGLQLLCELSVAVVDGDDDVGVLLPDDLNGPGDVRYPEGGPESVAA